MLEVLGDREIFIGRELTKKFEEKLRGNIGEMIIEFENRSVKGEIVIVINGSKAK
jgi:16S rRNA (cytidine1402-2'-O)-methyltransferase